MKKTLIALGAVLIVAVGVTAYLVVDHRNDIARAKQVKAEREARIDRAYKADLAVWRDDDRAWTEENDAYEDCRSDTAAAFAAADEVSGVISSGGSRDDYLQPIQDLGAAIVSGTRAVSGDVTCLGVLLELASAQDKFSDATNVWLDWMQGNAYLEADSPNDLPLDKHLTGGQDRVTEAESALASMEPGARPVKPERGKGYLPEDDLTQLDDESVDS